MLSTSRCITTGFISLCKLSIRSFISFCNLVIRSFSISVFMYASNGFPPGTENALNKQSRALGLSKILLSSPFVSTNPFLRLVDGLLEN
jgi:hypothetical protein